MSNNAHGLLGKSACYNLPPANSECPLATLGRNNRMETHSSYHHPLSPSPLDPHVYQRARESPDFSVEADDIIYTSVSQQGDDIININVIENDIDGLTSDSQESQRTRPNNYKDVFHLQTMSTESCIERPPPIKHKAATFELRDRQNFKGDVNNFSSTASSSVGRYRQQKVPSQQTQFLALGKLLQNRRQEINGFLHTSAGENTADDFEDISNDSEQRNHLFNGARCNMSNSSSNAHQFFLANQIEALNLGSVIRSLPIGSENSQHPNERFFMEDRLRNFNNSDGLILPHTTSSPSETSGSDVYLLNRTNSPGATFNPPSQLDTFSSSNNNSVGSQLVMEQRYHHSKLKSLTEGLSNLGRFSPSLDQGYATLVTSSPNVHNPNTITTHSIVHSHPTSTPTANKNTTTHLRPPPPWNKRGPLRAGPFFDCLSDDLIAMIFSWMDSCDLCNVPSVCRRFEQIAWRPSLWRIITLKGECLAGDKALKMIFRQLCGQSRNGSCSEVEKVLLSDGCRISDKGLQLLARRCPELTHLQLQSCVNVTQQALVEVLTKCSNLQHLDVTGCLNITSISPNQNLEPPRRLLLQYLDLTDCMALDDVGLKIVVKNCPQLIYLYLRRCINITDAGLKFVPSFCISLKELSISDCINITDFGLYELAKLGAALRYLSVAKCDRVSDAGLKVIARRCYKLRYLNTRGCEAVSDDSITVLARSCSRLRALDIGKCDVSDAGLRALAESCPNLKKLSLRNCDMITDRGIQCIAYYCRGLQQLNIQDCQISIEGYRAVKKYCKRCIIEHTNPGFC